MGFVGPPHRLVRIGGVSKEDLLLRLQRAGVRLNDAASALFSDTRFTTSAASSVLEVVELGLADLGFPDGARFAAILERAQSHGLIPCPLELGPHLRLQYTDQPEGSLGYPPTQFRAPPGSVTVASLPLDDLHETPKGFYLRRINGELWLRGFRSDAGHVYAPEDVFAFVRAAHAAKE
jgi:hypothetical protein